MAFTTYKNQVKNITLANLIKSLSSYKLSIAAESEVAKKPSCPHTVFITYGSTSLNKPDIYFRADLCRVLVKIEHKCKICKKYDKSCICKATKITKRQSIILSTLAKLNALVLKDLSERLKLTSQSFRMEKNLLKEKVMEL